MVEVGPGQERPSVIAAWALLAVFLLVSALAARKAARGFGREFEGGPVKGATADR